MMPSVFSLFWSILSIHGEKVQICPYNAGVSSQYKYVDLASKERAFFTPEAHTPIMDHARSMKVVYSEVIF